MPQSKLPQRPKDTKEDVTATKKKTGFLDLPRELRDSIYKLGLTGETKINRGKAFAPGLLLSCKQVYSEARLIFYQSTTFYFVHYRDGVDFYAGLSAEDRKLVQRMKYDHVEDPWRLSLSYRMYYRDHNSVHKLFWEDLFERGCTLRRDGVLAASIIPFGLGKDSGKKMWDYGRGRLEDETGQAVVCVKTQGFL